jgi:hypothetical protein
MPRELVLSTSSDDLPIVVDELPSHPGDEPDTVRGQRGLAVCWTRAGALVSLGPVARAEDGSDVDVPGHWVNLDWSQCNRLIRFLRNARDQAFGRPE